MVENKDPVIKQLEEILARNYALTARELTMKAGVRRMAMVYAKNPDVLRTIYDLFGDMVDLRDFKN